MYYEERMIDGVMHYRTNPKHKWTPYTVKELSRRYERAMERESVLQARLADIKQKVADA